MQQVDLHINRINTKLQELLKKHSAALKELEQQQKRIDTLLQQQILQEKKIRTLEEQQSILKAAAGSMNPADKKAFEQSINKYIREIDKCIDLLSE
mgnify:FL=1